MSYRLQGAPKNEKTSALYALSKQRMYLILYFDVLNLQQRNRLLSNASVYMSNFELSTDASNLNVILNLRCPPECIPLCCEYVKTIYKKRESYLICVDYDFFIHIYCMWIIILLKVSIKHILHETRFIVVPWHCIFNVLLLWMWVFRYFCSMSLVKFTSM